MNSRRFVRTLCSGALAVSLGLAISATQAWEAGAFIPQLLISSTIPGNGDLNPYGIAFVPPGFPSGGAVNAGDVLVANFNASSNLQGTGTTIIQYTPSGAIVPSVPAGTDGNAQTFFHSPLNGLTTALGVLKRGFVIVGNVPTTDGTIGTIANGALQVLDRNGKLLATWVDGTFLDSPWDLTIDDNGDHALLFVSNVLSGTVARLELDVDASKVEVKHKTIIATGYKHEPNGPALVVGPTGLAFDEKSNVLYVASTDDNAIYSIAHAANISSAVHKGALVFSDPHLAGPLGLAFAPNGDLLTSNGDALASADPTHPSEIIEFTREGNFVREFNLDAGTGAAFGIATALNQGAKFNVTLVNDATNAVWVAHLSDE